MRSPGAWSEEAYYPMLWSVLAAIARWRWRLGETEVRIPREIKSDGRNYVEIDEEATLALASLWGLGRELLEEIVPRVLRRLSFTEGEEVVGIETGPIRGRILWQKTLHSLYRRPRVVYTAVPRKRLLTPENLLMVKAVWEVRNLALSLLMEAPPRRVAHPAGVRNLLRRIESLYEGAEGILSRPGMREILREASRNSLEELLEEVRGQQYGVSHLYYPLVEWVDLFLSRIVFKLRGRSLSEVTGKLVELRPPADTLYEFYVFLLLVEAGSQFLNAWRPSFLERTVFMKEGEIGLRVSWRESSPESLESLKASWIASRHPRSLLGDEELEAEFRGYPDIIISLEGRESGSPFGVIECKFSADPNYLRESLWKALGYLEMFQADIAVLAFPTVQLTRAQPGVGSEEQAEEEGRLTGLLELASYRRGVYFADGNMKKIFAIMRIDPRKDFFDNVKLLMALIEKMAPRTQLGA